MRVIAGLVPRAVAAVILVFSLIPASAYADTVIDLSEAAQEEVISEGNSGSEEGLLTVDRNGQVDVTDLQKL